MHEPEKADRRVSRTISNLRQALVDLILEKHYDEITVQDIIDRANVGRSTFYNHFRDKEDLFIGHWETFLRMVVLHIDVNRAATGKFVPLDGFMLHLKDFHAFYRALVRSGKTERLFYLGTEFLAAELEVKIEASTAGSIPPTVSAAVCAHFIAVEIFGLLKWWLDRNMPYSPVEMDKIFHELVAPGIANIMENGRTQILAQTASQ